MSKIVDLTNVRFGRLVALRKGAKKENRSTSYWECACDCGNVVSIRIDHLRSGKIQSCGCILKEVLVDRNTTHGMAGTPEYKIWFGMLKRCYNPKHNRYHRYGGRGIKVCKEWINSFEAFYKDMGPRPSSVHSIERRDNDKDYCKDNCYWATKLEQANNTSTNVYYDYDGERKTLAEWCREFGVEYKAMHHLLRAQGKEFEDAMDILLRKKAT